MVGCYGDTPGLRLLLGNTPVGYCYASELDVVTPLISFILRPIWNVERSGREQLHFNRNGQLGVRTASSTLAITTSTDTTIALTTVAFVKEATQLLVLLLILLVLLS